MNTIEQFAVEKKSLKSHDDRMTAFRVLAKSFGTVDEETLKFRKQCAELGFSVVFRSGLSRTQTLDILRARNSRAVLKPCQ